jgi:hypothetical protein
LKRILAQASRGRSALKKPFVAVAAVLGVPSVASLPSQPHRRRTFTLSDDEFFVEKVRDIVALYLNPPDHTVVLRLDEKSRIQALERRQPVLPLIFGQPERVTATYNRHGTTNLFAALDVASGKVIGECYPLKRAAEFRRAAPPLQPGA